MKKLIIILALGLTAQLMGCGKTNVDTNNTAGIGAPVGGAGVVTTSSGSRIVFHNGFPIDVNPITYTGAGVGAAGSVPVSCYYLNNSNYCSPCPVGYFQSGSACYQQSSAINSYCPAGSVFNGTVCAPQSFGCLNNSAWSWQYNACISNQNISSGGYYCTPYGYYGYLCYYVRGAPQSGYFFNGYGWVKIASY